nr:immunoglobulin heavy chain junction region [Mus musculus]MBK4186694.1 immunoglobulin heavy chain junction region [Mus musculus]MBK4195957.1 immunoglobulin heavy chain junction region [Mus musculus]MBK4195958.1 immunoglobulin heavy chain junction region [Mus musculus]
CTTKYYYAMDYW